MPFEHLTKAQRRAANKQLREQKNLLPMAMTSQPESSWKGLPLSKDVVEVWRNWRYLACVYNPIGGAQRVSINRTIIDEETGRWLGGLAWEDIQTIKREIGRGDHWAVEVYPSDSDVVDVANMRHIWLLPGPPSFAWRKGEKP